MSFLPIFRYKTVNHPGISTLMSWDKGVLKKKLHQHCNSHCASVQLVVHFFFSPDHDHVWRPRQRSCGPGSRVSWSFFFQLGFFPIVITFGKWRRWTGRQERSSCLSFLAFDTRRRKGSSTSQTGVWHGRSTPPLTSNSRITTQKSKVWGLGQSTMQSPPSLHQASPVSWLVLCEKFWKATCDYGRIQCVQSACVSRYSDRLESVALPCVVKPEEMVQCIWRA